MSEKKSSLDKIRKKYEIGEDDIVPFGLAEMMVAEYEQSETYNQEKALFDNLQLLYKSHEVMRDQIESLNQKIIELKKDCADFVYLGTDQFVTEKIIRLESENKALDQKINELEKQNADYKKEMEG